MESALVADRLVDWIRSEVGSSGARGVLFGLSGGIDSAVVAALVRRAAPTGHLALILPVHTSAADLRDANLVVQQFELDSQTFDLDPIYEDFARLLGGDPSSEDRPDLALANMKSRLRMVALYYQANRRRYLVAGTGNRSELSIGYFTKFGDGAADLMPLGHLVKSEVIALAEHLGVPRAIIDKPPSADNWRGHTDEVELGFSYEQLEQYVLGGLEDAEVRNRIAALRRSSAHKLRTPKLPPSLTTLDQ